MKTKECTQCGTVKPLTEFHKDNQKKDSLFSACKKCTNFRSGEYRRINKTKIAAHDAKRRSTEKHKARMRAWTFKKKYGLTLVEHELMYISQNGKCAICEQVVAYDKIHTDHNHKTGKVRGLICGRCNLLLAGFDDKDFYNAAIKYLEGGDRQSNG